MGHDFKTPATGAVDLDGYAAIPPTPWGEDLPKGLADGGDNSMIILL